jgi:glutamate N-acetyltransferase / amino-acid N-acetyltransferase
MAVAVARPQAAIGAVTAARGFAAAADHAGIRRSRLDLAVLRSTVPAVGAGMFTANRVQAAPVLVSKAHLRRADPQAIVINSGVANAATGKQGELDALATATRAAELLDLEADQVLVLSTGVIGARLPMERLLAGLAGIVPRLSPAGGSDAAEAILTTDTYAKEAVVSRGGFTVGGMAKGAGMIHPRLATMLAVVTTDYPLAPGDAHGFLKRAVGDSFNRISVDGECSTNDTVILLGNGASGIERTPATDREFGLALREVCADLSRQIVLDGEGATVLLEIEVTGAASPGEANAIAQRIATSPLVKTAAFGRDPNWGRILAAAGSAFCAGGFAQVEVDLVTLRMNGVTVFADGEPTGADVSLEGAVCRVELELGLGTASAGYLASDLTYDYVRINAEYTT